MKISAIDIYSDYCRIKKDDSSYRLGQHYCNVLGLEDTLYIDIDLFNCANDNLSEKVFREMCEYYNWDVFDLPIFGGYDLNSVKSF